MHKPGEAPREVGKPNVDLNRVQVPCCEYCNRELNRRFERNPRHIVERMFGSTEDLVLEVDDAALLGLWLVKTMLMLVHPAAVNSVPSMRSQRWDISRLPNVDLYSWTVTDSSPPDGLSVWLSRVDTHAAARPRKPVMHLPTVVADGLSARFMAHSQVMRMWEITLLCHPGWPVIHPLESTGEAVREWPPVGDRIDLAALPAIDAHTVRWVAGPELWFDAGAYPSPSLPNLTHVLTGHDIPVVYARAVVAANEKDPCNGR